MARLDLGTINEAALSPAVACGETLFRLGLMYSTGRTVDPDRVAAHKWFNLAALRGNEAAVDYRRELAEEMSKDEIQEALRQAREYARIH